MSDKIELNRRRVLGGLVTIGAAGAAVGAGTFAAFNDTETSENNRVEAGTLDLTIDGDSQPVNVLDVDGAVPGERETGSAISLANNGNVNGNLEITVASLDSDENGTNDPEANAADEEDGVVELESEITLEVEIDGENVFTDTFNNLSEEHLITSDVNLAHDEVKNFNLIYEVDGNAGNEIQSDWVSADFEFTLTSN